MQTIEQERAAHAWGAVGEVKGKPYAGKYLALARSAPADIQVSGLGQTLAFWGAKKEQEHLALLRHVSSWVLPRVGAGAAPSLLEWLTKVGSDQYRRATLEARAYLVWIKRFAEAELAAEA